MPELPEVETVRRTLQTQILGKTITRVEVYYKNILENTKLDDFKQNLIGQTFRDINRYGKYLIFILDDYSIISHLRMEGKFFLKNLDDELSKHEHIVFTLDDKISFRYHDTRKFGKMVLLSTTDMKEIMKYPALSKLGKEANDESFTKEELYEKLKKKNTPIKSSLLDQEIICGLGNIYVDEVCFMSKLNPKMPSNKVTLDDASNILESSRRVLAKAIKAGGTTIRSYTSSLGVTGLFQLELLVHAKEKEPCPTCGTIIEKEFVGGRGTYYCKKCQRMHMPKIIGITGSIASGKSTVSNYLKEKGYEIIDADEIVKEEKAKDKQVYKALVEKFGQSILDEDLEIDNNALEKIIFDDESTRKTINTIIHPVVYEVCEKRINSSNKAVVFLSVPLLYEAGFDKLCDDVICVNINEDIQIERLEKRNNLEYDEAKKRIISQMPLEEKCQKATFIIDNSGDLCYTIEQVEKILQKIGE